MQRSFLEAVFRLDEAGWRKHTNPWSGWSRILTLAVLVPLCWWRRELGGGFWPVLLIFIGWVWINPRLWSPPRTTTSWVSRAVLGERVWLKRREMPIPHHHEVAAKLLLSVSGLGALFLLYGLFVFELTLVLCGTLLCYVGKLWFLDRMVWLYQDMQHKTQEYQDWLY